MKKIVSLALVLVLALSAFTVTAAEITPGAIITGTITNDYSQGVNREVINFPYSAVSTSGSNVNIWQSNYDSSTGTASYYFTVQNDEIFKFYWQIYTNCPERNSLKFELGYIDESNTFKSMYGTDSESGSAHNYNRTPDGKIPDGQHILYCENLIRETGVLTPGIVYCIRIGGGGGKWSYGGSSWQGRVVAISEPLTGDYELGWNVSIRDILGGWNTWNRIFSPYYIYENALHVDSLKDGDTPVTIINPDENKITVPDVNGNWTTYNVTATYNVTENTFTTINENHTETTFTYNSVDNSVSISTVDNSTHTTITNNYYFYGSSSGGGSTDPPDSGGGSGGGDSGGDDWWQGIVSGGISGIIDFIGSLLLGIFDGLVSLLGQLKDSLFGLIDLFAGFTSFISAFMPFFPEPLIAAFTAGVTVAIIIAVVRLIRGK